jgi:hypothetical protein
MVGPVNELSRVCSGRAEPQLYGLDQLETKPTTPAPPPLTADKVATSARIRVWNMGKCRRKLFANSIVQFLDGNFKRGQSRSVAE